MDGRKSYTDEHTELERVLAYGIHGCPILKKEERLHFLGQLRERIILALTERQVKRGQMEEELKKALEDIRTYKMFVKGSLGVKITLKYERIAREHRVKVITVSNPQFRGNIGLVVVSSHAVDLPDDKVFPVLWTH